MPTSATGIRSDFNGDGVSDLAVGIPGADDAGLDGAGAVSVLYGSNASGLQAVSPDDQRFTQATEEIAGDPEAGEAFGSALASGDFSGDGFADLAIGVPNADFPRNPDAGEVNVLYGSSSGLSAAGNQLWYQRGPVVKGNPGPNEHFGGALATGDFNADGFDDLAIGIQQDVVGGLVAAGSVMVFFGSADGLQPLIPEHQIWSQGTDGLDDQTEAGDRFGWALATGDMNGDGFDDLAVGVPGEDTPDGIRDAGAVSVLYGSSNGPQTDAPADQLWTQDSPGVDGQAQPRDSFGFALAASGTNADRFADLAIGVPLEDVAAKQDAGAVQALFGTDAGLRAGGPAAQFWTQDSPGVGDVADVGDRFGSALAFGDFNGDGFSDLAVTAPFESPLAAEGALNVLFGSAKGLTSVGSQLWSQDSSGVEDMGEAGDRFAWSVAAADFNQDGFADLGVGVPGETIQDAARAGAVNALYGSASGLQTTSPPDQLWHEGLSDVEGDATSGDAFGSALSAG